MAWSKIYINGELIASDATAGVQIFITVTNDVSYALMKQTASGLVIAASRERLQDQVANIVYKVSFNVLDVAELANDNSLRTLLGEGWISGVFLGNNVLLGNWWIGAAFGSGRAMGDT